MARRRAWSRVRVGTIHRSISRTPSGAKTRARTDLPKRYVDACEEACVSGTSARSTRLRYPRLAPLEPGRPLGHAPAMDPLPPSLALLFFLRLGQPAPAGAWCESASGCNRI